MSLLTKDPKELIDKSPQKATNVVEKIYSNILPVQRIFHEIPDTASDNIVYYSPFINDFKHVSWYYKSLVKAEELIDEKDQIIIDIIVYNRPTKWEFQLDGVVVETMKNIELKPLRKNVYQVRNFISRRPLHTNLLKSVDQIKVNSDAEVYFYTARITESCTETILSMDNTWLFDNEMNVTDLSEVKYPIKSIKFKSNEETTSLKLGNVELVNIPRKLFVDFEGYQEWVAVDHRELDFEGACIPPSGTLNLDPKPDITIVTYKRTLSIKDGDVSFF